MADEVIRAGTEFTTIVPEIWSAKFYPTLMEMLPYNDVVARDYEGEISQLGDTVNINTFPQFDTADEILENEKADADSVTPTNTQLVINKQLVKDYILTKKAMKQSIEAQARLRDLAMHAIMKRMQQIIIDTVAPSASAPDHTITYTSGTTLALADILAAKQLLDDSDVEEPGRCIISAAAQMNDLFSITGFTSRDFIPTGSPLTEGAINTPVLGFNFKWTSVLSDTVHFFQPIFMQLAVQQNPEVNVYDLGGEGKRAGRVNLDVLFGVKQLSNLRVVTMS